ncbi:hypothetical protein Ahy_B08g091402 [Arachis hypogaea]|uniref:Uncharacterized protein n=1 Tax=Arachis hypogaea TaxID=3818 RepID=A0A444Y230_ARAHY|nr:hypothetical protein Ahy_B08g091402 [Arachis hypogaea]
MGYFPPPQNDASHDSNGGWEGNSSAPYDIHPKISSLDHTSTESPFQNSPPTQTSMNHSRLSELESMFKKIEEETMKALKREEIIRQRANEHLENIRKHLEPSNSKNQSVGEEVEKQEQKVLMSSESAMKKEEKQEEEATESSGFLMKNEVVKNETTLEMTKEHEESQLSQIFLDQNASTLESMIERYEEEMKKAWEDQQTSSIKELLKQMLGAREEVEEQESEKDNQRIPNSCEAEKYMKEESTEPPLQETLDEDKTPTITQQPSHKFKKVKAINKSTKKRIVTKIPRTTFMRRSTANNPPPDPASKINQANFTRKLAERKLRQGAIAESSPPLRK